MKCGRPAGIDRVGPGGSEREQKLDPSVSTSSPELCVEPRARRPRDKPAPDRDQPRRTPRDGHSASETTLSARQNDSTAEDSIPVEPKSTARGDQLAPEVMMQQQSSSPQRALSPMRMAIHAARKPWRSEKPGKYNPQTSTKKSKSCGVEPSATPAEPDALLMRQIREIHNDMRSSARIIKDSRIRLVELQKKTNLDDFDVKELSDRHELLLREMERFDRLTRSVQHLVDHEVVTLRKVRDTPRNSSNYQSNSGYEPVMYHEMKMQHPTVLLGHTHAPYTSLAHAQPNTLATDSTRSKSEIDLTRKLSESYDMQEKLVADNADLEVKRYILYKELMTKDQNLETCRAQIKRLQGELKLMSKENAALLEKAARNCPEGDASSIDYNFNQNEANSKQKDEPDPKTEQLALKLANYHSTTTDFEKQLQGLEIEVRVVREGMDNLKKMANKPACGRGTCYSPPKSVSPSKKGQPCGVCPPCPAPCNMGEPTKPIEREAAKLSIQLKTLEENYKTKVAECSILRADLGKKKDDLEKERAAFKDVSSRLKEAEQKIELMVAHTNMMLGTKEQAAEVEVNVRMLKQCYREAREEIDELRMLLKEQNEQLQNYRNKYMQTMQTAEEQKRQMDMMDMDNNRISEQINLEIQKIKMNFQERMAEFAPMPELLKRTQEKLKEALTAQAMAEHKVEKTVLELNTARERIHVLLHNIVKPPPEEQHGRRNDKHQEMLEQRIAQLMHSNQLLKDEIERMKANVIRMEEAVVVNEKRLAEKMQECAKLGGELDRTRDESERAILRANDRVETLRQTLAHTKTDLERQLAAGRAQLRFAERDREEIQCRMQCQIKRLRENYDQSQVRIMGLTTTIAKLRQANSEAGGDDGDSIEECLCGLNLP